jgi:hypothetical protein
LSFVTFYGFYFSCVRGTKKKFSFAGKFSIKLNKEERIHGNPSHFTKKMDIPIMPRDYWPSSVFAKTDEK